MHAFVFFLKFFSRYEPNMALYTRLVARQQELCLAFGRTSVQEVQIVLFFGENAPECGVSLRGDANRIMIQNTDDHGSI